MTAAGIAVLLTSLVACVAGTGCAVPSQPPERIVLVVIDMLRADHLGCYGGPVATPRIDALAASGRRYTNALSSYHQTTMSMGALFTGRTPSVETGSRRRTGPWTSRYWCGLERFAGAGDETCLPRGIDTLANALSRAGYETRGIASNPLLFEPSGFSRGFDDWREVEPPPDAPVRAVGTGRAVPFEAVHTQLLASLAERSSDRFFLYVHYMDVHDHAAFEEPYQGGVERVDRAVGALLDRLGEEGLLRHAVVILTADHGERLGESHVALGLPHHYGNPSFEPLLRVPLVVAPAPQRPPDAFVRTEDLHRWILAMADAEAAPPSDLEDGELFVSELQWQTYRRGRWKSFWARRSGTFHLVDLETDPGERTDVATAHEEVARRHRARIDELGRELAGGAATPAEPTAEDVRRLRDLGYLE